MGYTGLSIIKLGGGLHDSHGVIGFSMVFRNLILYKGVISLFDENKGREMCVPSRKHPSRFE